MMSRKLTRALSMPLARPLIPDSEFVAASAPMPTVATWSTTDKNAAILISGDDLIATMDYANVWSSFRANIGKESGTGYFEIVFPDTANGSQFAGIANDSATLVAGAFIGYDNNGIGYFGDGVIYRNLTDLALPASYTTQYIGVEVDIPNDVARYYRGATLVATISLATFTGPIFPAASLYTNGKTALINCGQSAFFRTPTSGITPYWSADA